MWKPTSKANYWDALEALTVAYQDHRGFLLGEPHDDAVCEVTGTSHPRYYAYLHFNGAYYASIRPLTLPEYRKFSHRA
jgi:hypothetical protein